MPAGTARVSSADSRRPGLPGWRRGGCSADIFRVIVEHPARELWIALGLYFDMQQNPLLTASHGPHLNQDVHAAPTKLRAADDLLEFLAKQLHAFAPVDLPSDLREAKLQRRLEVAFQDVLPRTVVIGLHGRQGRSARSGAEIRNAEGDH